MKDIFKKLETNETLPIEVKERLMENIKTLQLVGDIADLFSGKMGKTVAKLLLTGNNNNSIT